MKDYEVKGPDGKRYKVSAADEGVLQSALEKMFPPPPPDHGAMSVDLLRKLVEREPPEFPAFPEIPKPADPVDLTPLIDAIKRLEDKEPPAFPEIPKPAELDLAPVVEAIARLEAKEHPATDLEPLAKKLEKFGERLTTLSKALAQADAAATERHNAVIDALDGLRQVMSAPRKLVRENGRPVASVVDLDGEYDDRTVN